MVEGASLNYVLEPKAPIRYQVMNPFPEHWILFIPVHVDGSVRETQLQRAALPRILEGDLNPPEKVHPRTTLLRHALAESFAHSLPASGVKTQAKRPRQ